MVVVVVVAVCLFETATILTGPHGIPSQTAEAVT